MGALRLNKKAQAFVLLIFFIGLIVIGLGISVIMKPMQTVYDHTYNRTDVMDDTYQQFFTRSKTVWVWLPFILAIPLIIWVLIKAHERNQYG